MAAAPIRVISTMDDVAAALQQLQITTMDQAGDVQFRLDEQAPLIEAAKIKMKTQPGERGFRLLNPELLECKFKAKMELEISFNRVLDASNQRIDNELEEIEASIALLKIYARYNDNQVEPHGPPLVERNRGVRHAIYPHPPFPITPSFDHGTPAERIRFQHAFGTQAARNEAAARDIRAQRAIWQAKLRLLEVRQSILTKEKVEMNIKMRQEFKRLTEERSDLGVGYADYELPPLA